MKEIIWTIAEVVAALVALLVVSSLMPMTAVILMLRRKPLWVWGVVALIFLTIGVYYVFHNDIKGPMEFMICDRPIDVPAQWHHCYRFFWTGIVVETVTNIAGFVFPWLTLSLLPRNKKSLK